MTAVSSHLLADIIIAVDQSLQIGAVLHQIVQRTVNLFFKSRIRTTLVVITHNVRQILRSHHQTVLVCFLPNRRMDEFHMDTGFFFHLLKHFVVIPGCQHLSCVGMKGHPVRDRFCSFSSPLVLFHNLGRVASHCGGSLAGGTSLCLLRRASAQGNGNQKERHQKNSEQFFAGMVLLFHYFSPHVSSFKSFKLLPVVILLFSRKAKRVLEHVF